MLLSDMVRRAKRGEKIILTSGRSKTPVAEIVAIKPATKRIAGQFYNPNFKIPDDFDEMPAEEQRTWSGI